MQPLELYEILEREAIEGLREYLTGLIQNRITYRDLMVNELQYISQNDRLIRALIRTNSVSFKQVNLELLRGTGIMKKQAEVPIDEADHEYAEEFYLSGTMNVLSMWLENGQKESIEHMADLIVSLTVGMQAPPSA